jgi:hypothetical protein
MPDEPRRSAQPFATCRSAWNSSVVALPPAGSAAEVRIVDPLTDATWDEMAIAHPAANSFHSGAWARVLNATYRHKPAYLCFTRAGKTAALIPLMEVSSPITGRRGVSVPFSDFCPPLIFDTTTPDEITTAVSEVARERKWKHFELRGADFLRGNADAAASFYTHRLDLTVGAEQLLAGFGSNVRRNLRKAERSGVVVRILQTREAILRYYELHMQTRKRHGIPPQSRAFFLNIHEHVIARGNGMVVLAQRGSDDVAGAVFFHFGKSAVYKFGASDERWQEFRANNLVMWEAIRAYADRGMRAFHFGRTEIRHAGLRRFKLAWGADEGMVDYFRYDLASRRWATEERDLAGKAGKLFAHLPLSLNRLVGTLVYPHLD